MPGFLRAALRHEARDGQVRSIAFSFCLYDELESCEGFWRLLSTPSTFIQKKKTSSDLRRNALRKAEFLKRKNSGPEAKAKNPLDTAVSTPPTTPRNEDFPKKVEPKEDSGKETLSEATLMDTSPMDVVPQPSSPASEPRKSPVTSEIANTLEIPPAISPLDSPVKEIENTEDEVIHLSFCASNVSEASKHAKHNGFPES